MGLEQLGNVGEFVGAIAVVVSLAYVAIQIRQNTAATQAATLQQVCRDMREHSSGPAVVVEASRKLREGEELSFEEQYRWRQYMMNTFRMYENQWFQNEMGTLDDTLFRGYQAHVIGTLSLPGGCEMWDQVKADLLHPDFVASVERLRKAKGGSLPFFVQPPRSAT